MPKKTLGIISLTVGIWGLYISTTMINSTLVSHFILNSKILSLGCFIALYVPPIKIHCSSLGVTAQILKLELKPPQTNAI